MIANGLAPMAALAQDVPCHVRADFNCDQVVDGQDLGVLLSNWGTNSPGIDLNGNCEVEGGDLGLILANWGALPETPRLAPVRLEQEEVTICLGESQISGKISSDLQINPERAVFEGWATASIGSDIVGTMAFSNGSALIRVGGTKVLIDGDTAHDVILVNNQPVQVDTFIQDFLETIDEHGIEPAQWDETSQAIIMLGLLHRTRSFSRAVFSQQAQTAAPGFWCKAACVSAAAIIVVLGTAGCATLLAGCAAGTVITIGGLSVPCAFLIGLCAGGVFMGSGFTYHGLLQFWG